MDPAQLGLLPVTESQPAGAVDADAAPPPDVMEAPSFAADEAAVTRAQEQGANPASFLGASPAAVPAGASQSPAGTVAGQADWESDQNPYKQRVHALTPDPAAQARQDLAALPAYRQDAIAQLIQGGYDPAHATQLADLAATAAVAELNRTIERSQTEPLARQLVAQDIAERFSLPGMAVDPKQLVNLGSPRQMEARARQIITNARNTGVQTRVAQRVDTAETSGSITSGAAVTGSALNSFETIKAGLRQNRR